MKFLLIIKVGLLYFSGLTGGLAAPLVAAGAASIIGGAGAAALGSTAGVAIIGSLFGVAGAGLGGNNWLIHFQLVICVCVCIGGGEFMNFFKF